MLSTFGSNIIIREFNYVNLPMNLSFALMHIFTLCFYSFARGPEFGPMSPTIAGDLARVFEWIMLFSDQG